MENKQTSLNENLQQDSTKQLSREDAQILNSNTIKIAHNVPKQLKITNWRYEKKTVTNPQDGAPETKAFFKCVVVEEDGIKVQKEFSTSASTWFSEVAFLDAKDPKGCVCLEVVTKPKQGKFFEYKVKEIAFMTPAAQVIK